MTIINKQTFLTIALLTWVTLFQSCNLDQIENNYKDYDTAKKDGLFDKGWIPNKIIYKSMTDIYQRTSIDLNTCVFSYNLSMTYIEKLNDQIQPTQKTYKKPSRINAPSWWTEKVTLLNHYLLLDDKNHDTIYIAIDKDDNKIFGWY